ncbi:AzlC family ABC transporter permease [Marinobacterium jannaschii]|uniref:AzlC family ABC transporter permease n=1 Tax=Marinobacterium jannaschii TaxID=64970 RepID=UPI0009FC3729|nr:AzlC family ABC transporter permease [Marinobacterium jannaschii]
MQYSIPGQVSPSDSRRDAFLAGCRDLLPLVPGVLAFGLIAGANGVALGFSPELIMGMTALMYGGAGQLAAYQLIQDQAPVLIIMLTVWMINIRFLIYSATFAPILIPLKKRFRLPLTYCLSDQSYGLCAMEVGKKGIIWYFAGTAISMWACWLGSVGLGILVGAKIPPEWSLEFAIPLAFLTMLVSAIKDRLLLATAVGTGLLAVLLAKLPYQSGFIVAVAGGVGLGLLLSNLFLPKAAQAKEADND